jgi:hypothetical protein
LPFSGRARSRGTALPCTRDLKLTAGPGDVRIGKRRESGKRSAKKCAQGPKPVFWLLHGLPESLVHPAAIEKRPIDMISDVRPGVDIRGSFL